jgi:preprotein translocase subunit SecB
MTDTTAAATNAETFQFIMRKIYLKDVSFETPNSPAVFFQETALSPEIKVQFTTGHATLPDDNYEVVLTITVSATDKQGTVFLVEIQQAGVFQMRNFDQEEKKKRFLAVRCPIILFPYAREAIDNLMVKGGFPPLMLATIDFAAHFESTAAKSGVNEKNMATRSV